MTPLSQLGLTPRGVTLLTVLVCAVGVAAAVFWPRQPLPGPRSVKLQEAPWTVPTPLRVDADQALGVINGRPLWTLGAPGAPGAALPRADEPPLTPPDWRIVGTVIDGAQRQVLISTAPAFAPPSTGGPGLGLPAQAPKALKVGDTLPGGARIFEIRPNGVCLLLNGRQVFLSTTPQ